MSEPAPKIRLRNVRKSFGEKLVLDGIDLAVVQKHPRRFYERVA